MKNLLRLFASACVLAFAAPASAQLSARVDSGYAHVSGEGDTGNDWNVDGAVALALPASGLNFQGNVGYSHLSSLAGSDSDFNGGIDAFLSDPSYRAGVAVNYTDLSSTGLSGDHLINYEGFGEFFIGGLTFGAKGGGFSGSDNEGGYYGGAEAVGYVLRNLALSGTIDYAKFNKQDFIPGFSETDFTAQGEWLISSRIPFSLYTGYTFSSLSHSGGRASTVFAGVRLYLNGFRAASLEERQRSGPVNWADHFGPIGPNL